MRITSAKIKNIRSHKDTELSFERITTISGLNHSGKSSLRNCLEMAFARHCEVTEGGKERQQSDLLRFGEKQASVELGITLDGVPLELRASLTDKSGLTVTLRNPTDKTWDPLTLEEDLRADRDVLSCLCDNHAFVTMDPKEQKTLMASIILPATYDWPENIKSDLYAQRIGAPWKETPFVIIEHCYKLAFDMRRDVNRSIKDWRPPAENGKYDGPPIDEVRHLLSVRQHERTQAAVEQQKLAGEITRAKDAKANHERRTAEAQAKITTEQGERARIAENMLSKAKVKELEKEAGNAKKVKELDAALMSYIPMLGTLERQIAAVTELETISECPTCHQIITDEAFAAIFTPLKENKDKLLTQQREAIDQRKSLGDPDGAQKKLDAHNAVAEDLAHIDKRIKDLERTAASANEEAHRINPDDLPKPETLNEKIADLDARIQRGTGFLEQAARADALKADAEKAAKVKSDLDAEIERLERLVIYFGPKGVKAELIAKHIGGFEEKINAVLSKWGYGFSLSIEPWSFSVRRTGSQYACQLHMLSRSEKLRFANAFSVALAIVSGWNFVVLDDSETIVGEDRRKLNRMLLESELEQAIVLAAETIPNPPEVPGTCFIELSETLEDGVSTTSVEVLASTPKEEDAYSSRESEAVPS